MFKLGKNKAITGALILLAVCFIAGQIITSPVTAQERPILRGAASTNIKLEGESTFENSSQPITVSLRDSDVKQALRMFADKAGLNIVFHDGVKGKITLDLVDVPLGDVIKMIAQMSELTYVVESNTVMVMPNDVAKKMDITKKEMKILPLKYVDAGTAADFLNANVFRKSRPGLSNSYVATANPTKNELILFGREEDFNLAEKVVAKIDVKPYISTYKVNHTTPKEMAKMICESLFGVENASAESGTNSGWEEDIKLGGAYKACRVESEAIKRNSQNADSINDGKLMGVRGASLLVSFIPSTGNIQLVGGSPEQIQLVSDFIAHNDRKQPQAYIEMSIIELSESGSKEFNSTWNIYSSFFTGTLGGNGFSTAEHYPIFWKSVDDLDNVNNLSSLDNAELEDLGITVRPASFGGAVRGLIMQDPISVYNYQQAVNNWLTELQAWQKNGRNWTELPKSPDMTVDMTHSAFRYAQKSAITQNLNFVVQNGKGRVLSNPKIIVTNGKKSVVDLTADIVESVSTQVLQSANYIGGGTLRTYNIADGENGIKIEVVPFISPDGYVSLNLKPSYKTVAENIYGMGQTGQNELVATLMRERSLELSNVRIKDGETLVLAGLIQEYEAKSVTKTPILGDLPIIGFLFRNSTNTNQKSELVILITPRIIKDNEDVAGVTSL